MEEKSFTIYRKVVLAISTTLLLLTFILAVFKGFNFSIDFTGGIVAEFSQEGKEITAQNVRNALKEEGFQDFTVQTLPEKKNIIITMGKGESPSTDFSFITDTLKKTILNTFTKTDIEFLKIDFVSPQIGKELIFKAIMAIFASLLAVLLYISIRFEIRYSIGAVIALLHDVILSIGFISLFSLPVDVSTIAAILTIVGYSINDSVVIFDRIRENAKLNQSWPNTKLIFVSIKATLSRTIITSFTTLLAVLAIILLGGETLRPFALIIFFGIFVGTLSSIFIAPIFLYNRKTKE
jgi:preprotein translocase subunit SecF